MADAQTQNQMQYRRDFPMVGTGLYYIQIPSGLKFVTILNATDNHVELYDTIQRLEDANPMDALIRSVPYYNQTLPLRNSLDYTLIFRNGGGTDNKMVSVIFTFESLNINGSTAPPGTNQNVSLTADMIGLAKSHQLPSDLTTAGNLRVEVENTVPVQVNGAVEITNDEGNSIPVNLVTPVDIGTMPNVNIATLPNVNIGSMPEVDINAMPAITIAPNQNVGITPKTFSAWKVEMITFPAQAPMQLPNHPCHTVTICCPSLNTQSVLFGDTASTAVFELKPGEKSDPIPVSNTNKIYVYGLTDEEVVFQYGTY